MSIVITITAYNEEKNLANVLETARKYGTLIVVDDGSFDNTSSIAKEYNAHVIKHPFNLGQGIAVLTGFKVALTHPCQFIVEMDGDGQHNPNDIPKFISRFEETNSDIVVGSRILGSNHKNAPLIRRVFLPHFTWVINKLTGYSMTDSMCGFRVFKADSLRRVHYVLDQLQEPQYLAAEMFIRFSRAGLTISEIPIHLVDRQHGMSYKGCMRYGWGVIRAILVSLARG